MVGLDLRKREVKIIGAACAIGSPHAGCANGPDVLHSLGIVNALYSSDRRIEWTNTLYAERTEPSKRTQNIDTDAAISALASFSERLASEVSAVVAQSQLALIIGGDHSCAIGTWRGVAQTVGKPVGLIWIDAHLDSHTEITSPSGALHGMPLACLLGHGLIALSQGKASLLPQHVCVVGARSFEAEEAVLLMGLGVRVFGMDEIQRRGLDSVMAEALTIAQNGTAGFGVSIDLDVIDPRDAPAVGTPAAGGLRRAQLVQSLAMLARQDDLLALEIAEYNPHLDVENRSADCVRDLLHALLVPRQARVAVIELEKRYGASNYAPLPVVLSKSNGVYVKDEYGKQYIDMMSAYSAISVGHAHPRILQVLYDQAHRLTVTSRAFYNDRLPLLLQRLCEVTGFDRALPMNTGMEAVETALKAARKWAYKVKGVVPDQAEIIVCEGNFHGRSITIVGFSSEAQYRDGFGPYAPGFTRIAYGDAAALERAITPNTAAFLVEPVQGEAGIIVPPRGYLAQCAHICREHNVLLICDEIQTGLGRTGKMLACEHENVKPDAITLGKALGGGVLPVSAFLARDAVMQVFTPGDHGSTFGGNPLGAAVALEALNVIIEENLVQRSAELGAYLLDQLRAIHSPLIRDVRGLGLFVGVEVDTKKISARRLCEKLLAHGVLSKDTHETVLRFAPPLIITHAELDWALDRVRAVFAEAERELRHVA